MIPLRDANPTRRTPVVTLSIIAACFLAFGVELYVMWQGGENALVAFAKEQQRRDCGDCDAQQPQQQSQRRTKAGQTHAER